MVLDESAIERFWGNVAIRGENACWEWEGQCRKGYGYFNFNRMTKRAHRVSYTIVKGQIPKFFEGMPSFICHSCDNRKCCNPAHLFLGNHKINQKDSVVKNRHKALNQKGEKHSLAKKTDDQIRGVRVDLSEGVLTQRQIAKKHDLLESTVSMIKSGKQWSHIK